MREGARRMGVVANCMLTLSLVLLVCWWKLSAALFVSAWIVYGVAYVVDGFASESLNGQTANR
jgi:hypothetical protein